MKNLLVLSLLLVCAGCAQGPAKWAEDAEARLQCGMSVTEVRSAIGRNPEQLEVPIDWATHLIRDGSTDLRLGFPQGKLRWVQVLWAQKMMKMASYQRADLCGEASQSPKAK
jgi:hypothetical protein